MVTSLLLATATLATALAAPTTLQQDPTVRVSTNKGDVVKTGDRVRVYVETVEDGYLIVLHAEPDGRLRFLFPLDPFRDNFVRGGRKFEIRGRGDREAIRIFHDGGFGTIYAAYFPDPFEYQDFIFQDHWDYRAMETYRLDDERDPEAELTAVTQHVAGQAFFEYDVVHYGVGSAVASGGGGGATRVSVGVGYGYGGYGYGYNPSFSFGISFGWGYPYHHRYSHLYNCGPYWYDAWTCGSLYRTAYWYAPYPYYNYGYYRPYSYYSTPYYYSSNGSRYGSYGSGLGSSGHVYAGRYAFKPNQGSSGGVGFRTRTFASRTETGSRRNVVSTPVSRRVATSTRLRQASQSATDVARRVQPSGWGISNGRRTVTPARAEPTRAEGQVGFGRRTVERTAVRSTTELERQARDRSVSNARRLTTGRSRTTSRAVDSPRRATRSNQISGTSTRGQVDRSSVSRRSSTNPTPTRATQASSTSRVRSGSSTTTPRRSTRSTTGSSRIRTNNARATPQRSTRSTRSGSVSRPSVSRSAPSRGGGARPAARAAPRSNPVRRPAPARRRPK